MYHFFHPPFKTAWGREGCGFFPLFRRLQRAAASGKVGYAVLQNPRVLVFLFDILADRGFSFPSR
jgi:hypothetical protein